MLLLSLENKNDEDENLPSMETLEISKNNTIQSISSYFGGEEEEEIPDMAEFEEADNLVENDPVNYRLLGLATFLLSTKIIVRMYLIFWS